MWPLHCQRERRPWAYLWNVGRPGSPVARLGETIAEMTCVAWCQESSTGSGLATLVTASDDMRHQLWRQRLERDPRDAGDQVSAGDDDHDG